LVMHTIVTRRIKALVKISHDTDTKFMAGGGAWENVNGTYFATKSLQKLNVTTCSRILFRRKSDT